MLAEECRLQRSAEYCNMWSFDAWPLIAFIKIRLKWGLKIVLKGHDEANPWPESLWKSTVFRMTESSQIDLFTITWSIHYTNLHTKNLKLYSFKDTCYWVCQKLFLRPLLSVSKRETCYYKRLQTLFNTHTRHDVEIIVYFLDGGG